MLQNNSHIFMRQIFQPLSLSFDVPRYLCLMLNRARNLVKLFPESDLFGIVPKNSKTTNFAAILPEKLNITSLFLEIQDFPQSVCHGFSINLYLLSLSAMKTIM